MITEIATAAEAIRSRALDAYAAARSNGDLTVPAIRARIAQAFVSAQQEMGLLVATAGDMAENQQNAALRTAFGTDDLAGRDPANRAALAMNARDAAERVSQIALADVNGALALLNRADIIGDEVLARAIGQRAFELQGLGLWTQVFDQFLARRPAASKALAEATARNPIASAQSSINSIWLTVVPAPPELAGMSDWQAATLAAQAQA